MTDKEKIKAEIERLEKEWRRGYSSEAKYRIEVYNELLSFIESLPEEPVSEDLERVAQAHAVLFKSNLYFSLDNEQEKLWINDIEKTFIEGAQWDRGRSVNKACDWLRGFMECSPLFEYQNSEEEIQETIGDLKKAMEN